MSGKVVALMERWLEDPERKKRLVRWSLASLGLVVALEVVLPLIFTGGHHYFAFEGFPAFGSIYGLVSCIAIIKVSKWIGTLFLMRPEENDEE